jgi:hypothetical protein
MASAMARTSDAFPPPLLAALSGRAGLRQDAYLHELQSDDFGPKEKSFGRGACDLKWWPLFLACLLERLRSPISLRRVCE